MFVSLRIISFSRAEAAEQDRVLIALQNAAKALPQVQTCWVAAVSAAAVINAGDIVWRMTFASQSEALAAPLTRAWAEHIAPLLHGAEIGGVGYNVSCGAARPGEGGVWRALVFRVKPEADLAAVKALEDGLLLFPKYITSIRNSALSRVVAVEGPKAFTHVWEQEFDSLGGFTGDYMAHPLHWGLVDAFFDAEYPQYIVDPDLIQVVGEIDHPIMV
jgi:hypothetical protein